MANQFDNELETPDMEKLSSLAENIVYRVPGCDGLMIRKVLQEVYRDFCRRSCCLCGRRHFILDENVRPLTVLPIYGGVVDSIVDVRIDGRPIYKFGYSSFVGGKLEIAARFWPTSGIDEASRPRVDVTFVEIPKINSESVPSWFVQNYGDAVVSGVLARLMGMIGKAWSDSEEAKYNRVVFENAASETRMRFYSENTAGAYGQVCNADQLI